LSIVAFSFLAIHISGEAENLFRKKDAPQIVIDEIAGFQFALFLITPTAWHILGGVLLFRIFDILKPFPAGTCQKRLPGGYGVVMDDIVAGIYANVTLRLLIGFFGI
jgi:phosphatidylglycerophosphatase A